MLTRKDFEDILSQISTGDLEIRLRYDDERPYLQVFCQNGVDTTTGQATTWSSRKWMLSPHMCKAEVVRTAHKAYVCAILHEADENFKYKGVPIFSPHMDVDMLAANFKENARIDGMTGI
jgi:hypothetical protein